LGEKSVASMRVFVVKDVSNTDRNLWAPTLDAPTRAIVLVCVRIFLKVSSLFRKEDIAEKAAVAKRQRMGLGQTAVGVG